MSFIDRYVYAVVKRLPQKQREDIEKEIRTLIDDMLEQHEGNEAYETKLQKVLLDLGDPALLADNYRESKRYLIGPQSFDNYIFVLKLVLGAIFIGVSVATITGSIFSSQASVIDTSTITNTIAYTITDYIAALFYGLLQGFAWVTGVFAISEYNGVKLMNKKAAKEGWSVADLPVLPHKAAVISRVESVISIMLTTIFTGLFYFAPQIFAAYINSGSDGLTVIPVFNIEVLSKYRVLIVAIFILGILKEVLKLISGRWTLKLSISLSVIIVISAILGLTIFSNAGIWNASFLSEVSQHINIESASINPWINFSSGMIIFLLFVCIVDVIATLYKGIKYNITK